MMENNDKLIRSLFEDNKQEIANNGFRRKVMKRLPQKKNRILTFLMISIAIIIFAFFIAYDGILGIVYLFLDFYITIVQISNIYTDPISVIIALIVLIVLAFNRVWSMD